MIQSAIQFFIFDRDELSATLIENYLKIVSFPYVIHRFNDFDSSLIPNESSVNFIFVDVSSHNDGVFDKIKESSQYRNNVFFMMSSEPTTDLYIKALRAGTREFLRKPIEKESFIAAIKNNIDEKMFSKSKVIRRESKIIAATSFEKNCGKTFFAINLASELAFLTKEKVLLIDFNENLNNVTFTLDIDHEFDTNYFLQNITEENVKEFLPKLYKYKDLPLYIMSSCMYKAQTKKSLYCDNTQQFLNALKRFFRFIIIDVNNESERTNNVIFSNTDMIFYLVSPNVSANSRNKNHINMNFDKKKFRIILNKYRDKDEAKLTEIENVLEREVFYKIPINLSVTVGFNSKGRTIREINPNLDIMKKYNNLAKYVISRV